MRRIKFFTPRDTGGLNVLDKRLLLVVPLAFDGSMADGAAQASTRCKQTFFSRTDVYSRRK